MPPSRTGLQLRQPFGGGVAQNLVAGDDLLLAGRRLLLVEHRCRDPADLAVEAALGPGLLGLALRSQAELVDILAGDAAPLGDPLGGLELVGHVDVPRLRADGRAVRTPTLAPSRTRLIASMPQAMPMLIAPAAISPAMRWLACWPQPHWQSTVVAPTCSGRPAVSHAMRVMLLDCSPDWVTHPPMTCSTSPVSMPAFSTRCLLHGTQQFGGVQARQPTAQRGQEPGRVLCGWIT